MSNKVGAIALVGGTHGNELTGVHLIHHWQKSQKILEYPEFQIELMIANSEAVKANRRYLDVDLNRCFKISDLNNPSLKSHEQSLAKQLNQMLGPKGEARVDFIIDLHTSTANMKTNIVLIKQDAFHLSLAAFLKQQIPEAVITSETELMTDHHFLCSIADKGIVIEVGPIAQGTIDFQIYQKTQTAIEQTLRFIRAYNRGEHFELPSTLEIMTYFDRIYFPQDEEGNISAMIAPELIGNDFLPVKEGDSLFNSFAGESIYYHGEEACVAFVNEAAYYDQKLAMCLCRPRRFCLETFQPLDSNEK
ncbi:aspartoacylase [Aliikangiella sp. G2MR2-5]|uniref:aspartoacylase n=1 Tax=Aliikangiella sp. G2MR2-5 TaxID=2788943 RepID=UPI0018A8AEB5|nr:aspartoacylase [Aliikangiella sp. G2MR2-5]